MDLSNETLVRILYPVDKEAVLASVRKTGKALVVHEDNLTGGYRAEIAAIIGEYAFTALDAPAVPFSHPRQDWFMVTADKIADAVRSRVRY